MLVSSVGEGGVVWTSRGQGRGTSGSLSGGAEAGKGRPPKRCHGPFRRHDWSVRLGQPTYQSELGLLPLCGPAPLLSAHCCHPASDDLCLPVGPAVSPSCQGLYQRSMCPP
ncbi:unnamed protein product [Gadus morhua 'NCC']